VVEVLSNGNLIVAGEKQIGMNKGTEYIRFSGMINPDSIATGNTVQSTAVADARVEYRTANSIDRAELSSMASRFFQSLLPF
jgi:flagellar L-ring protein precursor FlgH